MAYWNLLKNELILFQRIYNNVGNNVQNSFNYISWIDYKTCNWFCVWNYLSTYILFFPSSDNDWGCLYEFACICISSEVYFCSLGFNSRLNWVIWGLNSCVKIVA